MQKKETAYMVEIRNLKQSLKEVQTEVASLSDVHEETLREKDSLHAKWSNLKNELSLVEGRYKQQTREFEDGQEELKRTKVRDEKDAVTVDRSRGLQIFSLTLSH